MGTLRGLLVLTGMCLALAWPASARAQDYFGDWVRTDSVGTGMIMTVEACCGSGGRRLTYRVPGQQLTMVLESKFDGSDAPLLMNGKPSGETLAIKRLDDHHTFTILKLNGKQFGTSKAALSPDGKNLTIEDDFTAAVPGHSLGKHTETWVKK